MNLQSIVLIIVSSILIISVIIYLIRKLVTLIPFKSFEWIIASNYFQSNKNKGFISLISNISIIGMVLGTAAVIIASSFMNGMQKEVENRIISGESHIKIRGFNHHIVNNVDENVNEIKNLNNVKSISPKVYNYALVGLDIKSKSFPILVNGIDDENIHEVKELDSRMIYGKFNLKEKEIYSARTGRSRKFPGIVLGKYLADNLRLSGIDTGKIIVVAALPHQIDFNVSSKLQQFYLAGIVDLGFPQFDETFAYVNIDIAQKMFNLGSSATYLSVMLRDITDLEDTREEINTILDYPLEARSWKDDWAANFSIMEWEKKIYQIALSLIICLAAFNILSTLYMMVKDKTREIGVLRSLGANSKSIMMIFINQGVMIGIIGATGGVILGLLGAYIQDTFHVIRFPKNTLIIDYLPVEIIYNEVIITAIFTIIIASLSGLYPAFQAARLKPVEAFRYE